MLLLLFSLGMEIVGFVAMEGGSVWVVSVSWLPGFIHGGDWRVIQSW